MSKPLWTVHVAQAVEDRRKRDVFVRGPFGIVLGILDSSGEHTVSTREQVAEDLAGMLNGANLMPMKNYGLVPATVEKRRKRDEKGP